MTKKLKSFFLIVLGSILVSVGTYFFLAPNKIAAGGTSGLSIIIHSIYPRLPIGGLMLFMEIFLFTLGIIIIGPVFGGKTIFCSFFISGIMLVFGRFFPNPRPISNDTLIQLIFGILISGIGIGIVFNQNASTGGTDIIAKIINKYFKISIGKSLLAADILVTITAAIIFGLDKGLYSILGVFINSTIIDYVIKSINSYRQVAIISSKGRDIENYIMETLDRSATLYYAKGAYNGDKHEVITTILNRKELLKLKDFIKITDDSAFITVNEIHEVWGNGFASF